MSGEMVDRIQELLLKISSLEAELREKAAVEDITPPLPDLAALTEKVSFLEDRIRNLESLYRESSRRFSL